MLAPGVRRREEIEVGEERKGTGSRHWTMVTVSTCASSSRISRLFPPIAAAGENHQRQ